MPKGKGYGKKSKRKVKSGSMIGSMGKTPRSYMPIKTGGRKVKRNKYGI